MRHHSVNKTSVLDSSLSDNFLHKPLTLDRIILSHTSQTVLLGLIFI